MNDSNNNLNGTVLGNLENNSNNNLIESEQIETLDSSINSNLMQNQVIDNTNVQKSVLNSSQVVQGVQQEQPLPTQGTFFSAPPASDSSNLESGISNQSQGSDSLLFEPSPQNNPMPAYTNPQSIKSNMAGFENSGLIGTTPPISLEPEKKPKKKGNKLLFVIIILLVLAAVGFGTYYVLNYTSLLNKASQITVETKNLEINIGDNLSNNILDYAIIKGTDSRNCSLDIKDVDSKTEGNYSYKVTCGDTIKNGNIKVIDNTELVVETITVYKTVGETIEAKEFVKEEKAELDYEFVETDNVNNLLNGEPGTYTVKIKAIAKNGKTAEVDGTLIVTYHPIKGYLICTSNEQNVTDSNAKMILSNKFAIVNDGNNGYGKVATEIYNFKYTDETDYANLLATYKTENRITINNITGSATFDDANFTITITNTLDNNRLVSQYGEENLKTYGSIMAYYRDTLGYKCSYEAKK